METDKEKSSKIRDELLLAIEALMRAITIIKSYKTNDYDQAEVIKNIGITVGNLDVSVLMTLYKVYPDLDDLKQKGIL